MYLRKGIFNELCRVTDCFTRQQIKVDCNAGELIEMIDRLWPNDLAGRGYGPQWNEIRHRPSRSSNAAAAGSGLNDSVPAIVSHVETIQIAGRGSLIIFHLENYLILIVRLLDQIDVVLGVSVL